jgi:homoserine O-acetyltransferase
MIHAAAKVQAAGGLRVMTFDVAKPLQLSSGAAIRPLTMAFETYGALNSARTNAVLVCHDLVSDQFVASPNPITGRPAWWPRIVGPGRPIDTNRFFVVCSNVLGGHMGSTGPGSAAPDGQPYALRFPTITLADIVRAQAMLVEALDIQTLFLVIGPGFGGMQALNWASAYPKRVFACVTVASAARQSLQNAAFSELGRQAIMADPDWRNGAYAAQGARPARGTTVARIACRLPGASTAEMHEHLGSTQAGTGDASERTRFVERLDANSFIYLTRAMDGFDLSADFGGRLANAFQGGATRHGVFAFSSDWRHPPAESRAIARALIAAGAEAAYVEIPTENGHHAYLAEEPSFETALTGFIDAAASARGLPLDGGPA